MTLSSYLDVEQGSTLNMAGYPLSAPTVYLGWGYNQPVSVLNRGPIAAPNLDVYAPGQTFNLNASDNVTDFQSQRRHVYAQQPGLHAEPLQWCAGDDDRDGQREQQRGRFPAAAALTPGGLHDAQRRAQRAAIFDTGHGGLWSVLRRPSTFGSGSGPANVLNRGPITTANLNVYAAGQTFNLNPSDSVTNFNLYGGTCTLNSPVSTLTLSNSAQAATTLSGSVSSSVNLYTGSTLTLGASMTLNSYLDVEQGSTLNMAGYPLSAPTVYLGWGYNQPVSVLNGGPISTNNLYVGGSSTVTSSGLNDVVNNQIALSGSEPLRDTAGQWPSDRPDLPRRGREPISTLSGSSVLQLTAGSNSGPSWVFRWQDPPGRLVGENAHRSRSAAGQYRGFLDGGLLVCSIWGGLYLRGHRPARSILYLCAMEQQLELRPATGAAREVHRRASGPVGLADHRRPRRQQQQPWVANSPLRLSFFDTAAPSYNLQGNAIELSGDVVNQIAN